MASRKTIKKTYPPYPKRCNIWDFLAFSGGLVGSSSLLVSALVLVSAGGIVIASGFRLYAPHTRTRTYILTLCILLVSFTLI